MAVATKHVEGSQWAVALVAAPEFQHDGIVGVVRQAWLSLASQVAEAVLGEVQAVQGDRGLLLCHLVGAHH